MPDSSASLPICVKPAVTRSPTAEIRISVSTMNRTSATPNATTAASSNEFPTCIPPKCAATSVISPMSSGEPDFQADSLPEDLSETLLHSPVGHTDSDLGDPVYGCSASICSASIRPTDN